MLNIIRASASDHERKCLMGRTIPSSAEWTARKPFGFFSSAPMLFVVQATQVAQKSNIYQNILGIFDTEIIYISNKNNAPFFLIFYTKLCTTYPDFTPFNEYHFYNMRASINSRITFFGLFPKFIFPPKLCEKGTTLEMSASRNVFGVYSAPGYYSHDWVHSIPRTSSKSSEKNILWFISKKRNNFYTILHHNL